MKNKLIIALLLVSSTILAQNSEEKFKIPKNQWTIGGDVNFYSSSYESNKEIKSFNHKNKSKRLEVKPEIGYAINNNLILGLGLGYSFYEYGEKGEESKRQSFSVRSYLRKYFSLSKRLAFNIQGELSFTDSWSKGKENGVTIDSLKTNSDDFFIGFRPGITYSLTHKIYLNANMGTLGFYKSKYEYSDSTSKSNSFNFNIGTSSLGLGVLFLL